jgi:hypothetical protein
LSYSVLQECRILHQLSFVFSFSAKVCQFFKHRLASGPSPVGQSLVSQSRVGQSLVVSLVLVSHLLSRVGQSLVVSLVLDQSTVSRSRLHGLSFVSFDLSKSFFKGLFLFNAASSAAP